MRNLRYLDQTTPLLDRQRQGYPAKAPLFLPFIYGERCPGWEKPLGRIQGLKPHHGVAEMYYAVLEDLLNL